MMTIPHAMNLPDGDRWLLVTASALRLDLVEPWLHHERVGGICLFVGTTRRITGGRITEELRYEAFDEMAIREMDRLVDRARARWPVERVALHHRTGIVPVPETSVLVGVGAPHRTDAFEACRFLIDTLKELVPVWKKEVYEDGSSEWVEPGSPVQG